MRGSKGSSRTGSSETSEFWNGLTLHELFEKNVDDTPDATALVFEGKRFSYREVDERANRVARRLARQGVGPESLVALSMDRSPEVVIGILGILKAGGAYVPLDPAYPPERLEFMLEDSGARVLLTRHGASRAPNPSSLEVVFIEETSIESEARMESGARAQNLAYVIYTSGSTGRPKGVLVTHGNVVRLFESTKHWFQFSPDDVWTLFHSYAFDFTVWELWGAFLHGGSLVVVPYEVSRSPEAFYDLLARERVTMLSQTPSAFRQLVGVVTTSPPRELCLRNVVFGGEALELQGLRPWFERFGDERPRLVNMYGITETTVHVTYRPITWADVRGGQGSVIGVPIPDLRVYLLDESMQPVLDGSPGEIFVEGAGLARGYLNRPELTLARFVAKEIDGESLRLYRSGDLAKRLPSGELEYLGRIDQQVKISGFRVELGEIESVLSEHPAVREVVVVAREDVPGDKRLVAYISVLNPTTHVVEELRARCKDRLPSYMVPSAFVTLPSLPLTENGKVDRRALPVPEVKRPAIGTEYLEPIGELEATIAEIWKRVLRVDRIGRNDAFFDLGGSSVLAVASLRDLGTELGRTVPIAIFFEHPTVRGLAGALGGSSAPTSFAAVRARALRRRSGLREPVAIVGMAGRFPGAENIEQLWKHLVAGVETVRFFRDDELDSSLDLSNPRYVKARGVLDGADEFDAAFFGETAANAEMIDPQQRVLLQVAWAALEDAGIVPEHHGASIGVFVGTGHNTYLLKNVVTRRDRVEAMGELAMTLGNDKDFVATRIAHKLNLTGPALSVHTACSTSLVAVCQAIRSLLAYECDVALAGAASVTVPQNAGHLYTEGAMLSADGHTRSFDARANGTVFSDGAGIVVLKRLSDAEKDGDRVYAVIRGEALNNDGAAKASYTAPSVAGQAAVIAMAQAIAGIDPRAVTYVEAHGTATPLGDPVEIEALTHAFRQATDARGFCAVGSIKSNFGHLTAASGVAGLIKTALSLHHKKLPPSLFFESPNPNIDFSATPFFVQTKLEDWHAAEGQPRLAGVSSFGVGGTNAHVVLEEAPPGKPAGPKRAVQLLLVSAKTGEALEQASVDLASFITTHPDVDLADVACTLQTRRTHFARRRFVVAETRDEAVAGLRTTSESSDARGPTHGDPNVAFVFPGQGTQYVGMGRTLYETEPIFRNAVDRCADILNSVLGRDLRGVLFPDAGDEETAEASLRQTMFTQPALFTIGYALTCLWQSRGVEPRALAGHSVGEFVAACVAGMFSVEDAAMLVAERGRLMQALPPGAMLSVRAPAEQIEGRLRDGVALAASNGPSLCVISGPAESVSRWQAEFNQEGIATRPLHTSHAFHSSMMEPAVVPFAELVRRVKPVPPRIPIVSTATGAFLTDEEAVDPMYWARHLRVPVRFMEALRTLWSDPSRLILEVGPRATSATLARQLVTDRGRQVAINSLEDSVQAEARSMERAVGQLWLARVPVDWAAIQAMGQRAVVSLPSYPFARERHFLESGENPPASRKRGSRQTADSSLSESPRDAPLEQLLADQLGLMEAQLVALANFAVPGSEAKEIG